MAHYTKLCSTTNIIHVETSKSRTGNDLLAALQRAVIFFSDYGAPPSLIRMDNECAEVTKNWLATTPIKLELTPVATHRTNKAESNMNLEEPFHCHISYSRPQLSAFTLGGLR